MRRRLFEIVVEAPALFFAFYRSFFSYSFSSFPFSLIPASPLFHLFFFLFPALKCSQNVLFYIEMQEIGSP